MPAGGMSSRQRCRARHDRSSVSHWLRTAPAAERAEATAALARAYLYSDLSADDLAAAEGALIMLLDDPSPLVRDALARALAFSDQAPPPVILGARRRSAGGRELGARAFAASGRRRPRRCGCDRRPQSAGRDRPPRLPAVLGAAAIAEVGAAEACLVLIENTQRRRSRRSRSTGSSRASAISPRSARPCWRGDGLPAPTRQALVAKLSETLAGFVVARDWLDEDRAQRVVKEACEKATVTLAAGLRRRAR